ncbi:transcription elongation factor GreA [Mycoplasmopsis californica]|uniref:Transcription elongation factor GreA n=1 Tax=Mycoplasmopsis equigenitalium TaxID=114883 RepID=A0ABY5J1Y8_9BACT|nr:transcription elongation factor GreA [Mycoplasmopsis equigenitalium]UUD37277.1 transcription elongation factor GreA [Mycoplasmopsis equigenitalium]VEU69414.1 transcription elongation factor GreA [Mycoplasmopsis californica]
MKNKNQTLLTESGLKKLQEELKHLVEVERPEVIQEIKEARELGDLSENAEYDSARERQGKIEARISEIEKLLTNAKIIETTTTDTVTIGSFVKLKNELTKKTNTYQIVGEIDANPINKKISNVSPLAQSVLGHRVGEVVEVDAPEKYSVKILEIGHK